MASLTKIESSHLEGPRSNGSSYPESETAYFRRVYGSDHLHQLRDGHQVRVLSRFVKPHKRAELERTLNQNSQLLCENDPGMTTPGRSAYSLSLLADNLQLYCRKQARTLRWNQHYRKAVETVAQEVKQLLASKDSLKPMSIGDVAASEPIQRNLDKNAGYFAFETGQRSKGENLLEAVEWCAHHQAEILDNGCYGLPLVISHRSSNSKPCGRGRWKWRCRIILMQDVRALLMDGRFAIPFTELFKECPWGEGSMNQMEVRSWIQVQRVHFDSFYSSDYSKFDVSQPAWLLEDVFYKVMRPCFGELSDEDEKWFRIMVDSYIHKDIHSFIGTIHCDACQISGSLMTYALNTIVNQIVDRTALLMQGCDYHQFVSLKCGDDNLTFYNASQPWDRNEHCKLIQRYFGIATTLTEEDCGKTAFKDPCFLSRVWTRNGERRPINEVIWNLVYPERWRDYRPEVTNVSEERAEALVLYSSCLEQDATMREWFDVERIRLAADVRPGDFDYTYRALESLGSGFATPWLNFKFGTLKQIRRGV